MTLWFRNMGCFAAVIAIVLAIFALAALGAVVGLGSLIGG